MALTSCAESVGNFKEQLTTLSPGDMNLPRQSVIHNKATAYIHWTICKHYDIEVQDKHYHEHEPATVTEKNKQRLYSGTCQFKLTKRLKGNRPDIVAKDKKERTCLLIDMCIPTERNTSLKTVENSKCKDLEIEIEKTRGLKTATVPVIIGALGLVNKGTLFKTATGQRTFYYRMVSLWNALPQYIKLSQSLAHFKTLIRKRLLMDNFYFF